MEALKLKITRTINSPWKAALVAFVLYKIIRELRWALLFSPLVMLVGCVGLSASATIFSTPRFAEKVAILVPFLLRVEVEARGYWRRSRPWLETHAAWAHKLSLRLFARVLGKHNTPTLRAAVCAAFSLIAYTCLSLLLASQSAPDGASGAVALPVEAPTLQRPFLFLHVPGSGGVAMRTAILNHSTVLQATKFMPCFGGLKCAINTENEFNKTSIGQLTSASQLTILQRELRCANVIAGHFKMSLVGVLSALDRVDERSACPSRHWLQGGPRYTAVIVLRHPLQRIISHYYRFGQTGVYKGKSFSNLSATEVQVFLKQSGRLLLHVNNKYNSNRSTPFNLPSPSLQVKTWCCRT